MRYKKEFILITILGGVILFFYFYTNPSIKIVSPENNITIAPHESIIFETKVSVFHRFFGGVLGRWVDIEPIGDTATGRVSRDWLINYEAIPRKDYFLETDLQVDFNKPGNFEFVASLNRPRGFGGRKTLAESEPITINVVGPWWTTEEYGFSGSGYPNIRFSMRFPGEWDAMISEDYSYKVKVSARGVSGAHERKTIFHIGVVSKEMITDGLCTDSSGTVVSLAETPTECIFAYNIIEDVSGELFGLTNEEMRKALRDTFSSFNLISY